MPQGRLIATAFAQWRAIADQIRPKVPKLATIMDDAESDVLAYARLVPGKADACAASTDWMEFTRLQIGGAWDIAFGKHQDASIQ
ncbi:hypothetical protein [Mesorhizobium sp. M0814]|uniref:hypothetical protein n=1 Tax=unclassified Mesorhizobium TaxID=325217 RepID=UPI003335B36A